MHPYFFLNSRDLKLNHTLPHSQGCHLLLAFTLLLSCALTVPSMRSWSQVHHAKTGVVQNSSSLLADFVPFPRLQMSVCTLTPHKLVQVQSCILNCSLSIQPPTRNLHYSVPKAPSIHTSKTIFLSLCPSVSLSLSHPQTHTHPRANLLFQELCTWSMELDHLDLNPGSSTS